MRRGSTQPAERWGGWNVDGIVTHALGWHFREQPLPAYGVGAQAEAAPDAKLVTGRLVGLQIKRGDSWFGELAHGGRAVPGSSEHPAYRLGPSPPTVAA